MMKLTQREAEILAYLHTMAYPPNSDSPVVARTYLGEKLDWIKTRLRGDGDMFANLDPIRRVLALKNLGELLK